ncbi:isoprenylcysteine carboxylmethyltransferase family protein [Beijerinckia sp. L45]|uniref:methyltransferase family protein n=1 Tax=Beijerinckia sp. L45 TaxID=1641855 RepID=UPI00131B6864|nr:isoprenylcysteine carboxylmethyltransferase family protein [Beijerinckia sp. L45]
MTPSVVFDTTWSLWALSWILAAFWSAPAVERRDWRAVWLPYALIVLAIVFPLAWHQAGMASPRWWNVGRGGAYALAFATIPGFLFAWWARLHLGPLWSPAITRKQNHRVIDTGPYALVRHPIYTGILWAALTSDIAAANLPALVSFAALVGGFWLKARVEEQFLGEQLGEDAYAAYRRRVPMLVPWPTRRAWNISC